MQFFLPISSNFSFLVFPVLVFVLMLILVLLPAVISLSFTCILRVLELFHLRNLQCWRGFFILLFLIHRVCLCHFPSVNFLVFWSTCLSLSLVHFKRGAGYLTKETVQGFYFYNICCRTCFRVDLLFFWGTLFLLSLSFLFVWWCPFPIFPSICNFLFVRLFWSFSYIPSIISLFNFFTIDIA